MYMYAHMNVYIDLYVGAYINIFIYMIVGLHYYIIMWRWAIINYRRA